jgi:hypothetical protein
MTQVQGVSGRSNQSVTDEDIAFCWLIGQVASGSFSSWLLLAATKEYQPLM